MTPHDYTLFYLPFASIFDGMRDAHMITDDECAIIGPENPTNKATFIHRYNMIEVAGPNKYFDAGITVSKFMLLAAVRFKHDYQQTASYVRFELMNDPIPFVRIGVDYFKVINKETRYGGTHTEIKRWTKEEIKQDHSKSFLAQIPRFDDFTIVPDNKNYQPIIKNCYNLYSAFSHMPAAGECPVTISFLKHIFGEHYGLGLIYMKVLYEHPTQILPILCLVSADNETGKTTFVNFLEMIFGGNYVLISPDDLTKNFNSNYATKNIIAIEETFVEKQAGVEKLKALSTGKSIQMARKFIDDNPLPFFGKLILCTNKVKDFMRVGSREIRFWILEVPKIQGKKNVNIEKDLFREIPAFLQMLSDMPAVDLNTGSRMVFTPEQLKTMALDNVKEESRSGLYKDIEYKIAEFFDNHTDLEHFYASASDIKEKWFGLDRNVTTHYIRKTLTDEAGLDVCRSPSGKSVKYYRFGSVGYGTDDHKTGTPYKFIRQNKPDDHIELE